MLKQIIIILLCSLFFISCSDNKPGAVAENFLVNINNGDFEKAKEYCDKSTAKLIDVVVGLGGQKLEDEMKAKKGTAKIEIVRVEEKEDRATVFYKKESSEKESKLSLRKVDGDWKVSINKESAKEDRKQNHKDE